MTLAAPPLPVLLILVASLAGGQPLARLGTAGWTVAGTPAAPAASTFQSVAHGEGMAPGATTGFVWLVRPGTTYGLQRTIPAPAPLGFVLTQVGALGVFDRQGALLAELAPGEAVFLPAGVERSFGSAGGEPTGFLQIALVATEAAPQPLPAGARASEPFTLLAGAIVLDLLAGSLEQSAAADLPASDYPALLLVTGGIVSIRAADGGTRVLGTGESALLDGAAKLWNLSQHRSTFVVAQLEPAAVGTAERAAVSGQRLDPALDAVWERHGCPLNPANPPCLTVAQAAACAIAPDGARCTVDSDGDGCVDIGEVRLGLDAFDAADCLPDPSGQPAVNCLFPIAEQTCSQGDRVTG